MKAPRKLAQYAFLMAGVQALSATATTVAVTKEPAQFTSRVYFLIHESTPYQLQRSRKMIEREFAKTVETIPQLQGTQYQVVSDGNEVVFSMVSTGNTQVPFQSAVSELVGQLNGQVRTRGRYDFLRTNMESPSDNYLEVVLDDSHTRIRSLVARSITLRDLLGELKMQFGDAAVAVRGAPPGVRIEIPRFSYLIPGECASKQIDWSFGAPEEKADEIKPVALGELREVKEPESKSLDDAMKELAKLFKLTAENHHGTYIFSGECPRSAQSGRRALAGMELPTRWIPLGEGSLGPPLMARPMPTVPVHFSE